MTIEDWENAEKNTKALKESDFQQGREDSINKLQAKMTEMKRRAYQFLNSDYATGYISAISTLEGYAAELKEQKK